MINEKDVAHIWPDHILHPVVDGKRVGTKAWVENNELEAKIASAVQSFKDTKAMSSAAAEGGIKHDQQKPRMDLLDAKFLEGVADVLTFGANKYSANNWRGGIVYSRLIASLYRHLGAYNSGEDIDPESGLSHIYHIGCNAMFLSGMAQERPDLDDRYKGQ